MSWAVPLVTAGLSYKSYKDAKSNVPAQISYQDAYNQAANQINPTWNTQMKSELGNLQNNQVARGVYGQLPSDYYTQSVMGNLEGQKLGQIANMATAIQGQNTQQITQAQQNAQNALNTFNSNLTNGLGSLLSNYALQWPNWNTNTESDTQQATNQARRYNTYNSSGKLWGTIPQ